MEWSDLVFQMCGCSVLVSCLASCATTWGAGGWSICFLALQELQKEEAGPTNKELGRHRLGGKMERSSVHKV